ncbi:hypothetical protein Tsubulata_026053 [Turnera subulata]|uniref:Galactose oxidase/kelch repeat superfamily protein n=1 Tax=Turnera subulata TaxID=218843 RepID=A0A9Q0JKX0_9ROSI|nr:hypothetical protein Tsubulata_026053 [Turnera subulata]
MKRKSNQSVCFSVLGEKNTYWYTFEVSKEGEDGGRIIVPCRCDCGCPCAKRFRHDTTPQAPPFLSPTKVLPQKDREDPGWTVVGNQLYRLGGKIIEKSYKRTRTVRALDLTRNTTTEKSNDSGGEWQRKPRMLAPRSDPHIVVVGGKLYVLGKKIADDEEQPWGEVYDPATNTWEAMPRPPKILKHKFFWGGLEDDNEDDNDGKKGSIIILSVLDKILQEYNVATKSWNVSKLQKGFGGRIGDGNPGGPAVAVGRMLYWFCPYSCRLYGLHLDSHMLYKSELVVDVPEYEPGGEPMLGHLGGHKFFLLHPNYDDCYVVDDRDDYLSDSDYDDDDEMPKTTLIHCLKFSVGLVVGRKRMNISVESSQSFVINNGPDLMFNGCVVM